MRPGECRFERDMCDWTNLTDKSMASWRLATVTRRPANLPDKTFGAPGTQITHISFHSILYEHTLVILTFPRRRIHILRLIQSDLGREHG